MTLPLASLFLAADEAPQLVTFDLIDRDAVNPALEEPLAAGANCYDQINDGVLVRLSEPGSGPDRHALKQHLQTHDRPGLRQPTVAQRLRACERRSASQTTKPLAAELVAAVLLGGLVRACDHYADCIYETSRRQALQRKIL